MKARPSTSTPSKNSTPDEISQTEFYDVLYEQRLLVFVEVSPQSNKYHQVVFTKPQFKKLSVQLARIFPTVKYPDGYKVINLNESKEEYRLPDLSSSVDTVNNL